MTGIACTEEQYRVSYLEGRKRKRLRRKSGQGWTVCWVFEKAQQGAQNMRGGQKKPNSKGKSPQFADKIDKRRRLTGGRKGVTENIHLAHADKRTPQLGRQGHTWEGERKRRIALLTIEKNKKKRWDSPERGWGESSRKGEGRHCLAGVRIRYQKKRKKFRGKKKVNSQQGAAARLS